MGSVTYSGSTGIVGVEKVKGGRLSSGRETRRERRPFCEEKNAEKVGGKKQGWNPVLTV